MQGFLLIISKICLTTILSHCTVHAEIMKKKTSTFTIKSGETIMSSSNTTDVYSNSQSACAAMCLLHDKCCVASFSKESSICRLNTANNCCVATDNATGSSVMIRNQYIPLKCPGCISLGDSSFSIFEEQIEWATAKENCERLGGKLAELETSEENEFIKDELLIRNTGVNGYWIGGYNFHNDNDMEWVSQPNQPMIFNDMEDGEPNGPNDQLCMMMWKDFNFRWGDMQCYKLYAYVCEFVHR